MDENTDFTKISELKLFFKLYSIDKHGTLKDFAQYLAGYEWNERHYAFLRKMVSTNCLILNNPPYVMINNISYNCYRVDQERMRIILREWIEENNMDIFIDLVGEDHWILPSVV